MIEVREVREGDWNGKAEVGKRFGDGKKSGVKVS